MSAAEAEQFLKTWIIGTLDTPQPILNGLPSCPFARKALTDGKVMFMHCDTPAWETVVEWFGDREVLCLVVHQPMAVDAFHAMVEEGNRVLSRSGLIGLEDHPDYPERIGDVVMNNGRYQIVLVQRISDLEKARGRLEKTGYYTNWPADYRTEVTGKN